MLSQCLDHASPAQVVVQILRGHPVEPSHPFLQPRMGGIRVLDMGDTVQHTNSLAQVDRLVSHPHFAGRQCDGFLSSSIGTEDRIPGQETSEHREGLPMVLLRKDCLGDRARPCPSHQDRPLFPGEPAFGDPAAPFSGLSRKPAPLPIVRPQEKSLVGFNEAAFLPGLEIGGQGQESMPPGIGGFRVDSAPPGGLPDHLPFGKFLQEEHPAVLVMKTRKRHLRQGTEGALASLAPEALESARLSPWSDLQVMAMGTSRGGSHQGDHLGHQVFLVSPLDRTRKTRISVPMSWIQQLENIAEMCISSWKSPPESSLHLIWMG